jgi:uncharacterized membrane protein YgdD (TMEM256/DUF423 family)
MLLFHAAAMLGAAALVQQALLWRPLGLAAITAWLVGAVLFSGDIALRAFAGQRLFAMAAPSGGIILILAGLRSPSPWSHEADGRTEQPCPCGSWAKPCQRAS